MKLQKVKSQDVTFRNFKIQNAFWMLRNKTRFCSVQIANYINVAIL